MDWKDRYYYKFKESQSYLKYLLGLTQLDYWERPELVPYYYYICDYLVRELEALGTEDVKTLVDRIFEIFEEGGDMIVVDLNSRGLSIKIGIGYDNVNDKVKYEQERFVFAWSDFMSTLCLRLKFQYASLYAQEPDGECCKCGARGQTETDYESWESGIYPEDECYDRSNYYQSNTAWGLNKDRFCECYRHSEQ